MSSAYRPLSVTPILAAGAPLGDVVRLLQEGFVFVVSGDGITGFATPSDLDRHAARAHFYLLVAGVEMLLSQIVDQLHSDLALATVMKSVHLRARFEAAASVDEELRPVEYLFLPQLAKLYMRGRRGVQWEETRHLLRQVTDLRNRVMHPARQLTSGLTATALHRLEIEISTLCENLSDELFRLK